ncbi:hypothetical protein NUH87_29155 [Pseudomonas batumici]|uniref:hypothetical protein n=1 Tax=Pseudomonas batumici TaxID=226910 RepID=UPI0030D2104A
MFIKTEGHEAHFFGTPADFNGISRAIRKCKLGATIRLPLEKNQAGLTSLNIACTSGVGSIGLRNPDAFIMYPERSRNLLSPCFAMPTETQPGSVFFISRLQIDFLQALEDDSLDVVLHVSPT